MKAGDDVLMVIRPESVSLSVDCGNHKLNGICGTLVSYMYAGSIAKCTVKIGEKKMIVDQYNPRDAEHFLHAAKVEVEIPQNVHLLKKATIAPRPHRIAIRSAAVRRCGVHSSSASSSAIRMQPITLWAAGQRAR